MLHTQVRWQGRLSSGAPFPQIRTREGLADLEQKATEISWGSAEFSGFVPIDVFCGGVPHPDR